MQMEQIGLVFRGDYDLASMLAYLADAGFSHYDENLGDLKEVVIVHPLGPRADSGGDIGDFVDFADVFWELPKDVRAYISDYIDEEYVSVL